MRWTLAVVGAVTATGIAVAAALALAPPDPSTAPVASAPSPTLVGPSPNATPVDGSEVQPPAAPTASSDRLPAVGAPTPRATTPLPDTASARGVLVEGFPASVAGPAPGAEVIDSSVSSSGTVLQIALTARTDATPDDVIAHYRSVWADLGLSATEQVAEGSVSYTDPFTSVTLAFSDGSGTGTVYSVYGTLRTE